ILRKNFGGPTVIGVVAIQKRLEQPGVGYRLHPMIFLTRSFVAGITSPSTLPAKSAEANGRRRDDSTGSMRTSVPSGKASSGGNLMMPSSTVPVKLMVEKYLMLGRKQIFV